MSYLYKYKTKFLSDEVFYDLLEKGDIYLQHYSNPGMPRFFKSIKWLWDQDTTFIRQGKEEIREAACKQYRNPKDWIFYCGGRNSSIWIPTYEKRFEKV